MKNKILSLVMAILSFGNLIRPANLSDGVAVGTGARRVVYDDQIIGDRRFAGDRQTVLGEQEIKNGEKIDSLFERFSHTMYRLAVICVYHDDTDKASLLGAAIWNSDEKMVERIISQKNAFINEAGQDGDAPLHIAAQKGELAIVHLLVEAGARADQKNLAGMTPLALAMQNKHENVVDYLSLRLNS